MEVNQDNNSNEEVTINYKIKINQVLGKIFYDRNKIYNILILYKFFKQILN